MIKICPRCRRTFSGGTVCLNCQEEVALLDVADPAVRRAHLRGDTELKSTIRTYYGARSAMLMLFVSILFGLAFGVALLRKAFSLDGPARWGLLVAAVGCTCSRSPAAPGPCTPASSAPSAAGSRRPERQGGRPPDVMSSAMTSLDLVTRGAALGFSVAAPVGPIGLLCTQRTLNRGRLHGLAVGLGAATADALYGLVAGLGLAWVSSAANSSGPWLRLIGALFLISLGVRTLRS